MDRRDFCSAFAVLLGGALTLTTQDALADRPRRVRRRRIRRRIRVRRRIRRRVVTRTVFGRPFWVVPVGLAVGWELVHAGRVVVVKEIKVVEKEGHKIEVATVQDESGKVDHVEITREDTADNAKNLEGSVLADDDKTTPAIESEEEREEEVES
jgi:hypothetical protein